MLPKIGERSPYCGEQSPHKDQVKKYEILEQYDNLALPLAACVRYNLSAFFVTPPLPAPSGVFASALLCCLSRVPPAVCPSLLENTTTVCTSFMQSLSTYVHTPTPHSILRFRPAPQTPDLQTSNLPLFFLLPGSLMSQQMPLFSKIIRSICRWYN